MAPAPLHQAGHAGGQHADEGRGGGAEDRNLEGQGQGVKGGVQQAMEYGEGWAGQSQEEEGRGAWGSSGVKGARYKTKVGRTHLV